MVQPIIDFVSRFNAKICLDRKHIAKKGNRYFLINENLKKFSKKDYFFAGMYLGKVKNGRFFPSFNLLKMIAENEANKIIVDKKTEWLFICGRDIFKQGIKNVIGACRKDDYTLILNQYGECLGFGRILQNLNAMEGKVAIKNISDIGDFLRRERRQV